MSEDIRYLIDRCDVATFSHPGGAARVQLEWTTGHMHHALTLDLIRPTLKEAVAEARATVDAMGGHGCEALEAENARLRERLQDIHRNTSSRHVAASGPLILVREVHRMTAEWSPEEPAP